MPYYFNGPGMIYISNIFEKYGLDVPKTMDEFMDVCEALKRGLERDGLSHITPVTMRAVSAIALIPAFILVGYVQKYIARGFTMGAIK